MSRRDTIIIAVLVNAALLMILFATAIRSDHSKEPSVKKSKIGESKTEQMAARQLEHPVSDDLLNEFVTSISILENEKEENVFSFEETALAFTTPVPIEVTEAATAPSSIMEEIKVAKPKNEEQFVHVTVKKGDFLEKIAKTNNTTIAAIVKANNLSSTQLKIGQVLKVPLSEKDRPHQKPFPSPSTSREGEYYTVKEGDNPWLIASRNKIQLEELLRLNGLDEQKAKRLRPGDKLKIR